MISITVEMAILVVCILENSDTVVVHYFPSSFFIRNANSVRVEENRKERLTGGFHTIGENTRCPAGGKQLLFTKYLVER